METRWANLCSRLGADDYELAGYTDIALHYSQDPDLYHTLDHIRHCLEEFDEAQHLAQNPDAVELALWFHDIVYDRRAKDNEEKSAEFLLQTAQKANFPKDITERAAHLILATKHADCQTDPDCMLIADIDLAILGQPQDRFDNYERQVREEYAWVEENDFKTARAKILRCLLERPTIYFTQHFQAKYEQQARANLTRSLSVLA